MQSAVGDDLALLIERKSKHFRRLVWEAWANADLAAYEQTHSLPDSERGAAVVKAFRAYVDNDLVPLVRSAVPEAVALAKLTRTGLRERESYAKELVTDWIIERARKHAARFWFMVACEGDDRASVSPPDQSIENWIPPAWLFPERMQIIQRGKQFIVRCGEQQTIVRHQYADELRQRFEKSRPDRLRHKITNRADALQERLNQVLTDELCAIAHQLYSPNQQCEADQSKDAPRLQVPEPMPTSERWVHLSVARKLKSPEAFPTLSIEECRQVFDCARSTVYLWIDEGKLIRIGGSNGKRSKVLISTASVIALLNSARPQE